MRWPIEETKQFNEKKWHKWFAWYPVNIGPRGNQSECVWLEWVEKRYTGYLTGQDGEKIYEYRHKIIA